MNATLGILMMAAALLVPAAPLLAHHSFSAEFDASRPVTLRGAVTKVEWTNPHARFYVEVTDESGVTLWDLELGSPNALVRNGWTRRTLSPGDVVTVEGYQAKDGSKMANADAVTLSDGRRVFTASSAEDSVPAPQR